jgi:hypothetical protein
LPIQLLGKEAQFRILKPLDPNFKPSDAQPGQEPPAS